MSFSYPVAVKFSEIDLAGVVFNSHYLTWCVMGNASQASSETRR